MTPTGATLLPGVWVPVGQSQVAVAGRVASTQLSGNRLIVVSMPLHPSHSAQPASEAP